MLSGDGLLVRVRTAAKPLFAAELRALAELTRAHGNGQLELTRRANLQLRGITDVSLPALQRALLALGLAEATPELEQRLGLLVTPLAGRELAAVSGAIEQALRAAGPLPGLPSKFGIVLDADGGVLGDALADVRVECSGELAYLYVAGDRARATWLGACAVQHVPTAVVQLAQCYAELGPNARHTAPAWLAAGGIEQLRARLAPMLTSAAAPAASVSPRMTWLGAHAGWFGLGVPFGSASAETWLEIAALAERFGTGQIRVTPGRAVLLPGCHDPAALERAATQLGLIFRPGDPLAQVEACPGAPACSSALGETRQLARSLAPALQPGQRLHVSGCSKGCAFHGAASITLVHALAAHDTGSCCLGFDLDTGQTSTGAVVPLSVARAQLSVWCETRGRGSQS